MFFWFTFLFLLYLNALFSIHIFHVLESYSHQHELCECFIFQISSFSFLADKEGTKIKSVIKRSGSDLVFRDSASV